MDPITSVLAPLALILVGYAVGSVKIISGGNEALVERLGQPHRKLDPGVNFIIPFVDNIVVEETTREKYLDIPPQQAITKDNVSLIADGVVYWQVLNLEKAYYAVEDIETAIENLVLTMLASALGEMNLNETYSSRGKINKALLQQLDEATAAWGIKVTRVEIKDIKPPQTVIESLELERAAQSKKQASILEAQGNLESIQLISQALQSHPNSQEVLRFLVAQRYVEANEKLGESANSKVLFMDPNALSEALNGLMSDRPDSINEAKPGNGSR